MGLTLQGGRAQGGCSSVSRSAHLHRIQLRCGVFRRDSTGCSSRFVQLDVAGAEGGLSHLTTHVSATHNPSAHMILYKSYMEQASIPKLIQGATHTIPAHLPPSWREQLNPRSGSNGALQSTKS